MNTSRRQIVFGIPAALACLTTPAMAQSYPDRLIKVIVPYPAGGGGDAQTRMVCKRLSEVIGQAIVIDNRPGTNGSVGTKLAAAATPDGYTLVFGSTGQLSVGPLLNKEVGFDTRRDLVPVSGMSFSQLIMAVPASSSAHSVADLIAAGKKGKGLFYGTTGEGSLSHICGLQLAQHTGINVTQIPYKSSSHAMLAMLAGDLDFMFTSGGDVSAHVKDGKVRLLGVTGKKRSTLLPNVPTIAESGVSGWMPESLWQGFFAPAKTPPEVLQFLHSRIGSILQEKEIRETLNTRFIADAWLLGPQELKQYLDNEISQYERALKTSGLLPK